MYTSTDLDTLIARKQFFSHVVIDAIDNYVITNTLKRKAAISAARRYAKKHKTITSVETMCNLTKQIINKTLYYGFNGKSITEAEYKTYLLLRDN